MLFLAVFAVFAVFSLVRGGSGEDFRRLPGNTVPESYALAIEPNISSFKGQVDIVINVKTTTPVITLHSTVMMFSVKVTDVITDRDVAVRSWEHAEYGEQLRIWVEGFVFANRKYTVSIRFGEKLRDDAKGFFISYYTTGLNELKWLAATQFQTTYARSAFPCYDEPAFKTPFNISLKIYKNQIALSNMPIINTVDVYEKDEGNRTWVHFMQTPPMSTVLVAFFVGEFEHLGSDHSNLIKVYSHLGKLYQNQYINEAAPKLLKFIENYTGIPYNLPKLDLLAVPELDLGAMENRGLNVYREKSIFVNRDTKTRTIMSAKMMMEHVMSHQWFGDMLTPAWWDFVWLNEGFATYFEYFATATLEPDWRLEHFFVVEKKQQVLEYDQTPKHPLSTSVSAMHQDISNVFDKISYDKGAAIIWMLRNWVGEEVFKKTLNIYLVRNMYNVVKPEHLWNAFDNALLELKKSWFNNECTHTIMDMWTKQFGYPVVNIAKNDKSLVLTQERFSIEHSDINDTTKWFIGLSYTTSKEKDFNVKSTPTIWLDPSKNETIMPIDDDAKWHIFNIESTGFYRVNYTEDNWLSLIQQLNDSPAVIHILNRAQLIDDSFNLARAGKLNYTLPLNLIKYLEKEDDIIPWFSAMNTLNYVLDRMRRSTNGYIDVKAFVSRMAGIAFQKIDNLVVKQRNPTYPINVGWNAFSTWACKLDNADCTKMALSYFRRWRNGEEIPADIKDAAFCTGIRYGDTEDSAKILALYKSTKTYSEKASALDALACTENRPLLKTYLEQILGSKCPRSSCDMIETQDYEAFIDALSLTPSGIYALTEFLQNNLTDIIGKVKNGENMVMTIYSKLASKVSTKDEIVNMTNIAFDTTKPKELRNKLSTYHSEIKCNEKWFNRNSKTIREFVNPGSTKSLEITTTITREKSPKHNSNASSKLHSFVVLLQILALSISAKFLV